MTTSRWTRLLTLVAGLGVAVCTVLLSAQGPASLGAPAASGTVAAGTAPALPAASGSDAIPDLLVGPGAGAEPVRVISGADGSELGTGFPFGPAFSGGVRVAAGDVNGDGVTDIIAAMGPGGSFVRVFDGRDATEIVSGYPFGPAVTGGVYVAAGDVNGDGHADIIVGSGAGGGLVRGYRADATELFSIAPFGGDFTGGVQVAVGDVDGDGVTDLVTSQAVGNLVSIFSGATQTLLSSGFPYGTAFTGGIAVAVGDVNGDGRAEVVTAPATGAGNVLVVDAVAQSVAASVSPYPGFAGGVRVATADFDGDGRAEVITAPGPDAAPIVNVYSGGTLAPYASLAAYPATFAGGVFVAASSTSGPRFTSADATTFSIGAPGTFTVSTTATPPVTSIVSTGTLPGGVTFVDNGDGTATLAGTPTGPAGTSTLTFTASNGTTPVAQTFTLTVQEGPVITSPDLTTFSLGAAGSFTVTATGFPVPALSVTGTLPAGVTFVDNGDGTGTLGGTPAAGTAGAHALTITASNGSGADSTQAFTLTVDDAPAFTSAAAATFVGGADNTFIVTTSGFPVVASITETGLLPAGVTFTDHGDGTATLGGIPAAGAGGSYSLTLTGDNGADPVVTQAFTLTVNEAPAITSAGAAAFTIGTAGTFTVQTTGFPAADIASSGTLPTGVTFIDNADGTATLAGTAAAGTTGTYPLQLTATNAVGSPALQAFTLSVVCPALSMIPSGGALPGGVVGETYVQPMAVFGETGDFTWSISAGSLPNGLIQTSLGTLAGTPVTAGNYSFTVTAVSDTTGCEVSEAFTLAILEVPAQASADSFTGAVGNTTFVVGGSAPSTPAVVVVGGNVLSNDSGAAPLTAALTANATNGTVAMAPNGTFTYTPNAGFSGPSDSFTYQLTDGNSTTDTALVTIDVSNIVWYVNPAAGGGGTGTSTSPFQTLTAAQTEAGEGSVIYVHPGTLGTGITLGQGRTLWGAGAPLSIGGLSIPAGTTPVITGTVTVNGSNATVSSVSISTGAASGFTTSGTVTGLQVINGVAVNTTTGTAVNLANVTSGALGVRFGSVSSNGAANAIVLSNVNASGTGTVTLGSGTTDGAGGVIQNTSGHAILLDNARNVTLDHLTVQNSAANGLDGTSVTNLVLDGAVFNDNGDGVGEAGIHLANLWGDSAFHGVTVEGSAEANVAIDNASGTLSSLVIDGPSHFDALNPAFGGNSILVTMAGTAVLSSGSIADATIGGNGSARGLTVHAAGTATIDDFLVQTSTFTDNGLHVSFEQSNTANMTFRLLDNQMQGADPLQAVNLFSSSAATGGTLQGRIEGNIIGDETVAGSGSSTGSGIRAVIQGGTTATLLIDGNTIRETPDQRGMNLQFLGGGGATVTHNVTVTNNDVDHVNLGYHPGTSDFPLAAIYLSADNQGSGGNVTVKANIAGNTVPTAASAGSGVFDVVAHYLALDEVAANATCQLVGTAGDASTQLANTNTGDAGAAAGCAVIGGTVITPP